MGYSKITASILKQYSTPEAKLACIERHIIQGGESFDGLPFLLTIFKRKNPRFIERVNNIRKKLVEVSLDRMERDIERDIDTGEKIEELSNFKRQHQKVLAKVPELFERVLHNIDRLKEVASQPTNDPADLENGEPPFKAARTTNASSVSGLSSSNDGLAESSGGVGLNRISTPQTDLRIAEQFTRAMFQLSCRFLDTPGLGIADLPVIIEQLENLCKQNSIRGEAALKLVEVHLNPNLGIRDIDKAYHYYDIVCEERCEVAPERFDQGFLELAAIAMHKEHYSHCIKLLNRKIGLPPVFYDSEANIRKLPSFDVGDREVTIKILSLLSLAYYRTQNAIVAIRLLDLAAHLGDEEITRILFSSFEATFKRDISDIESVNKGFHVGLVKSDAHMHQDNPAKHLLELVLNEAVQKGYITTSHKVLKPLLINIGANAALSRYFCSTSQTCGASSDCSVRMIELCDEVTLDKENPFPLVAWIYVATNPTTQRLDPTRVERYATIAQQGGFSDPRTVGAPLYRGDLEQNATYALFTGLEQSLTERRVI